MSFAESYPTPFLSTISTFSMSLIFAEGSPSITTRSTCLPTASVAIFAKSPQNSGPFRSRMGNPPPRVNARLPQQFHSALVTEPGDHSAVSSGIQSRQQRAALLHELAFEFQFFLE